MNIIQKKIFISAPYSQPYIYSDDQYRYKPIQSNVKYKKLTISFNRYNIRPTHLTQYIIKILHCD